ncbi:T9SS type A sorting domain-containing protein [Paracrocinitomix mangrovi]|uniref:T9SS type A sorting domain-containing protein n=1 Tax=Paracrocinitomix mangrovi TaxID=2862509 RepID=UPI001C8DB64D|nr:T9SS type A sorting domain-containing protein [Paracrocinitomix mangrovi]UKN01186.1 T9SS type A sorting domain-containing protein [Paracrocinitomix mangrovi]
MKQLPIRLLFSVVLVISSMSAKAVTYTVTNTNDAGAGSLRQAILDANANAGADDINFSGIAYPADIVLTTGQLTISEDLTINGPGMDSLSINGNAASRCFNITSGLTAEISNLTIKNGSNLSHGGAIYSLGNLNLYYCSVIGNNSNQNGGAIFINNADLTLAYTNFTFNYATTDGGAVFCPNGICTIQYCSFVDNYADDDGGAVFSTAGSITIENSFFDINGSADKGGAIACQNGQVDVTNSTFSNNLGSLGGGAFYLSDGSGSTSSLSLLNVTMYENLSTIYLDNTGGTPSFTTKNSIFSSSFTYYANGVVNAVSEGYNMCSNADMDALLVSTGDEVSTDPLLMAPADNGGLTKTCALYCSSPAIDAGTDTGAPTLDQRGVARVGTTDMGAFENTIFPEAPYNVSATICAGETYSVGSSVYDTSGVYNDTLVAANTCDSIIITTLTVEAAIDNSTSTTDFTITAAQTGDTYQWINCDSNTEINGETNQSYTADANGNYAVVVTVGNCSDTSDCVLIEGVGFEDWQMSDVKIYPNPSKGQFTIELPNSLTESTAIRVLSVDGKVVYSTFANSNKTEIKLDVEPGLYLVELNDGSKSEVIRLVIE